MPLPDVIRDECELEDRLSEPSEAVVALFRRLEGDVLVLGAAGKMGPSLARMARRAVETSGRQRRILAVSRFQTGRVRQLLEGQGVETIAADLMQESELASLPDAANVVFMAGMKFGTTGSESETWAVNTWLPTMVCRRFPKSRIAAFSTGNVYGLTSVAGGGSRECDAPNPAGEYAMSCLGRERLFEYFSRTNGTPVAILRLNYACELRYGVLVDIARRVMNGDPVDLTMPCFNVIWQGDANALALLALEEAASPSRVINVTGPEMLRVRDVAERFATLFGTQVVFTGVEGDKALLNNASGTLDRCGKLSVPVDALILWIAGWLKRGGATLDKPTRFESVDGRF